MRAVTIANKRNESTITGFLANNWWLRMRGLIGHKPLEISQSLIISPCNSVHTFGMTYPLDVVYLNKKYQVIKITLNLKPWRLDYCLGATYTIEFNSGAAKHYDIKCGDYLRW
ncbi:MAG: DUF192 domain-containing protein [Alkalimonas sp.]|nr:DUF192 domain-containing protein [Alkalimonas sp.]